MYDHWIPRWIETLPWWVRWAFVGGVGALSAFLPTVLDLSWQKIGVAVGASLIAIAVGGAITHAVNAAREKRGLSRLQLEPIHIIIVGLVIALAGAGWQLIRPNKTTGITRSVRLSILRVRFDPSPGHEVYVDFSVQNNGPPTTLSNWKLSIEHPNDIKLQNLAPRIPPFPRHIVDDATNRPKTVDDFERDPIQPGVIRESIFMYSFPGDARTNLGNRGTIFVLSVQDATGATAETKYDQP
jgi:hypothetical protein